jgi:ribosomal protein S18 acetylase RimI-like enzyme
MSKVRISPAERVDFANIKQTMLYALDHDPDAFTSTIFEFQFTAPEWWEKYLDKYFQEGFNTLFLAKNKTEIVGMIAIVQNAGSKVRHVSNIYWMWVRNDYRGKGLGKKLLENALELAEKNPEIKKINLSVVSSQKAAIDLYKKYGFEICGTLRDEIKFEDGFRDFINMQKIFNDKV